jgi:hypothetical protein
MLCNRCARGTVDSGPPARSEEWRSNPRAIEELIDTDEMHYNPTFSIYDAFVGESLVGWREQPPARLLTCGETLIGAIVRKVIDVPD